MKILKQELTVIVVLLFSMLSSSNILSQVQEVSAYTFAHSLIDHRPPAIATPGDETTILHWIYDIAQHQEKQFSTTGQFGQLTNHLDELPPNSNLGYDIVPNSWDEEETTFENSDLNTVMVTAANFIQYEPPTAPDPSDPAGRSIVSMTEQLFDWTENAKPGMKYYIYGNWPEMDLQNQYPPNLPLQSEVDDFHDQTINGQFPTWWLDYQDGLLVSRPELNVRLIPVGTIISKILTEVIPNQIAFDELYEDSAPHGRANLYFLAGMITYMALYEENVSASYQPSDIVSDVIVGNMDDIRNFIWQELLAFNLADGESRVFYSATVNTLDVEITSTFTIVPNPTTGYFTIRDLTEDDVSVEVCSIDGVTVQSFQNVKSNSLLLLDNSIEGIYMVKVRSTTGDFLGVRKLVKK